VWLGPRGLCLRRHDPGREEPRSSLRRGQAARNWAPGRGRRPVTAPPKEPAECALRKDGTGACEHLELNLASTHRDQLRHRVASQRQRPAWGRHLYLGRSRHLQAGTTLESPIIGIMETTPRRRRPRPFARSGESRLHPWPGASRSGGRSPLRPRYRGNHRPKLGPSIAPEWLRVPA